LQHDGTLVLKPIQRFIRLLNISGKRVGLSPTDFPATLRIQFPFADQST
jgi:hypothetical protein